MTEPAAEQNGPAAEPGVKRITVSMTRETTAALDELTARRECSITEGIRRAVAVWKFAEDEIAAGNKIAVIGPGGKIREVVLL